MLKKIARKILRSELETYEKKIRDIQSYKIDLESNKNHEILRCLEEKKNILEEKCKIEKENEILRKYYDLGIEPSDEIKMKVYMDLELNRLKEENMKLLIEARTKPVYYPIQTPWGLF